MSDPTAPLTLTSPRGATLSGTGRWTTVGEASRGVRAGGVLAAGVVLAVPAVALPPHGVVSAAILGVSALGAYALWDRGVFLDDVRFTCTCGAAVHVATVGQWTPDTWVRCTACDAPWRVARG